MERTITLDMYEGTSARRMAPGECQKPVYDRNYDRRRTKYGREEYGRAEGNRVAWKEPVYDGRSRRPKSGGACKARKGSGRRACAARKEPGYAGRNRVSNNSRRGSGRRRKKTVQYKIVRGLCFYFFLAGIIATAWVIFGFFFGRDEKVHAEGAQVQDSDTAGEDSFSEAGLEAGDGSFLEITPEIRQECQDLYAGQEALLLLVNKEHELSASYQPALRNICKGRLQAADVLYEDLCVMLEAGGQEGYEYWIASAYRDRAYQQGLVDEDVQKYMAKGYSYEAALQKTYEYTMPAGQSEHETGLALDILCSTNTIMDESQKGEPGNRWLVRHCHEYGFILRYPEEKEDITGIGYEPWHFRYVGREAAAYLAEKGWTLEEYYEALGNR